jgi:hypothetical protein
MLFKFQHPYEADDPLLETDNHCSSITEQLEPVLEIEKDKLVAERSASKRSMGYSESEEAPPTKRFRKPKIPWEASTPAAAPPKPKKNLG